MSRLQTNADKTYTYVKTVISVAAAVPSLGGLKFVNNGLDVLYKNLQWSGILNNSITIEQETQLKSAINHTLRSVYSKLPTNKRAILNRAWDVFSYRLEDALQIGELDVSSINEMLERILHSDVVLEGEWLTQGDLDGLCALFLAEFFVEVKKNSALSAVVSIDSIRELFENIHRIYDKIDSIDYDVNDLKTRVANLERTQTGNLIDVTLQYLSYTLYGKVERPQIITHSPPIYTEHYIRRDESELRNHIKNSDKILISGMGGIGKTHFCSYMFKQYVNNPSWSDEIDCIGYLTFDGDEDDAVYSGVLYENRTNYDNDIRNMWSILEAAANKQRMLLFIDDVRQNNGGKSAKLILDRLSRLQCSIILASRDSSVKGFASMHLGFLSKEQCVELFKKIYDMPVSAEDETGILEHIVAERVGCHTLTLDLVANASRGFRWSLAELEHNLDSNDFRIEQRDSDENIQQALQKLYRMAGLKDPEKSILEAFSMFPYIPLGMADCVAWLHEDADVDENHCRKYIGALADKGWLQESVGQDSREHKFAMHSIVAAAVCGQSKHEYEKHTGLVEKCGQYLVIGETGVFTVALPYLPFAEAIAVKYESVETKQTGLLMHQIGYIHYQNGFYPKALEWYQKALAIREKVLGKEHPATATTYNNIALVYTYQGDYPKALEWYHKDLVISEKVLGKEHPATATTYNNIALVYSRQGDYPKALEWYQKALAVFERVLGSEHPNTQTVRENIENIS